MPDQNEVVEQVIVPPDLRTVEGAIRYLDYHSPDPAARRAHDSVNTWFQHLIANIWDDLPEGPGKTVAVRAIAAARMQCNSCIANKGS